MKSILKSTIQRLGFDVVRYQAVPRQALPPDIPEGNRKIYESVEPYTMTGPERVNALVESIRYVVDNEVTGDFVECGVWKGGSAMAMAMTLSEIGEEDRDIYLYDTFSGMSPPTDVDVSILGDKAVETFHHKTNTDDEGVDWCHSPLEEVKLNVHGTGYPSDRFHFIKGKVEDTIPKLVPEQIAVLRLDTDWYESTKHELTHLFPRLQPGGVLIIDDYGHWEGARKAVDEYVAEERLQILLNRIDVTCRIAVKTAA